MWPKSVGYAGGALILSYSEDSTHLTLCTAFTDSCSGSAELEGFSIRCEQLSRSEEGSKTGLCIDPASLQQREKCGLEGGTRTEGKLRITEQDAQKGGRVQLGGETRRAGGSQLCSPS